MKYPYCGNERIETGIAWGKSAGSRKRSLKFSKGFLVGVTQVYSDLCLDCGTITRSYIKDRKDRKWNKKPGSIGAV